MRDLAAYITDLAELLGDHDSVHCHEIRDGSVEVVCDVESAAIEPAIERMLHACHLAADPSTRNAYRNLDGPELRDRQPLGIAVLVQSGW